MPKVAGRYQAVERVKRIVLQVDAESKQDAIRMILLALAEPEDRSDFEAWVTSGMEIELVIR